MGKLAPPNVTTEEFAAFCRQLETHNAGLVGALLCAYGTCRDPRTPDGGRGDQEPESSTDSDISPDAGNLEEE